MPPFREQAPFNPLYACRQDRIGCFMCPSSDIAVIEEIKSRYPQLWDEWNTRLARWQGERDLPTGWITEERWRIREVCADEADRHR